MEWYELLKWGAVVAASPVAATLVYRAGRQIYDDLYERWRALKHDRLTLSHITTQNKLNNVRVITPNERGRYPLLYGTSGIIRDPNTLRQFTLRAVIETYPWLENVEPRIRALEAAGGWPNAKTAEAMLPENTIDMADLPTSITLARLLDKYNLAPSYHRLALGETVNQATGLLEPVTGDMTDFVHCIVTGQTGFGKSIALEAMAKQLIMAQDCDVCFVDYGVNTFGQLAQHGLYPIADTPGMAVALFKVLVQELHRRRERMAQYPQAKKLHQYNELSGDNLHPIVLFCDEASILFDKSGDLRELARELTGQGRKFGLGACFGGTDFKVNTMPSETRGNCGLRMALHLEEIGLSRSIIRSVEAVNLVDKGRALARLPGVAGLVEIQTPIVERWDDLPPLREQIVLTPAEASIDVTRTCGWTGDQINEIMDMHHEGMKPTPIAHAVFGYANTRTISQVRTVIAEYDNDDNGYDPGIG